MRPLRAMELAFGGSLAWIMTSTTALAPPKQFIGIDFGTSGARISVLEQQQDKSEKMNEVYTQAISWTDKNPYDSPQAWENALDTLFQGASQGLSNHNLKSVAAICISGTSGSCLVVDRSTLQVTSNGARMYSYDILANADTSSVAAAQRAVDILETCAPARHTARARTGSLAKLLAWAAEMQDTGNPWNPESDVLVHQSDYISWKLLGNDAQNREASSDWHNCLKLGYDVRNLEWPKWMDRALKEVGIANGLNAPNAVVPVQVVAPGQPMGLISSSMSAKYGFSPTTQIVGGTTDSNAAFFAAAGTNPSYGTAVTSLGSTLAMKQLSPTYVEDAGRGVYSHRFPSPEGDKEAWLVGGASNVGCAVLRQLDFSNDELVQLSHEIDPTKDSPLHYYPLTKTGERFPIADGNKEPILEPVPENRVTFLHGILQSIGDVERDGFQALQELGSSPPTVVYTCGGGSQNDVWSAMRQRRLSEKFGPIEVRKAESTEASYGAALLAASHFS